MHGLRARRSRFLHCLPGHNRPWPELCRRSQAWHHRVDFLRAFGIAYVHDRCLRAIARIPQHGFAAVLRAAERCELPQLPHCANRWTEGRVRGAQVWVRRCGLDGGAERSRRAVEALTSAVGGWWRGDEQGEGEERNGHGRCQLSTSRQRTLPAPIAAPATCAPACRNSARLNERFGRCRAATVKTKPRPGSSRSASMPWQRAGPVPARANPRDTRS